MSEHRHAWNLTVWSGHGTPGMPEEIYVSSPLNDDSEDGLDEAKVRAELDRLAAIELDRERLWRLDRAHKQDLAAAIAREREECAKVADGFMLSRAECKADQYADGRNDAATDIGDAIRARGTK